MSRGVDEPYPVLEIQQNWVLQPEALGSKIKFWYAESNDAPLWLFKYPQTGTGQHWAEKIAAEVAEAIHVLHARVDLAVFQGARGSATESFARKGRELYHGNQVVAVHILGYDPDVDFKQSDHTLENIYRALDGTFVTDIGRRQAKGRLADYLVFDALIGNTDRHHENWGILYKQTKSGLDGFVAPTFDHASSLGRELLDDRRRRLLSEQKVGRYSERARGAIFWTREDPHAVSPLELVRRGAALYPDFFRLSLEPLRNIERRTFERIVRRIPADWMSQLERTFAVELMCYNLDELMRIIV
jgi:HipA-like C-terminal domain